MLIDFYCPTKPQIRVDQNEENGELGEFSDSEDEEENDHSGCEPSEDEEEDVRKLSNITGELILRDY